MNGESGPDTVALGDRRLVLVITGSVYADNMPFWLSWLQDNHPDLQLRVVITRSAQRFVTRQALQLRTRGEVSVDEWPEDSASARHVELSQWAEAIAVYPATFHFIARLATGFGDSPALLAAQCFSGPIAIAPALPPGGFQSPAFRSHWRALGDRRNVVLLPPHEGRSAETGKPGAWVPPLLPEALNEIERRRAELSAGPVL
ncbi:flavoprotein [Nocardia mexicana]|uniref:Flavoprotein n=1 Tax=Nocardia mexicana TaxID=279262 RepID=A0A370GJQ7_9NOCA|nr:flavoprotein [Nocardia mexicana]RDI43476.1 flavoprotein [Nocardia mexicana]